MTMPRLQTKRRVGFLLIAASVAIAALYLWPSGSPLSVGKHIAFVRESNWIVCFADANDMITPFQNSNLRELDFAIAVWETLPKDGTRFAHSTSWGCHIATPIWLPAAALLCTGLFRLRPRFRFRPGYCPNCRYDLSGLPPGAPCTECGSNRSSAITESRKRIRLASKTFLIAGVVSVLAMASTYRYSVQVFLGKDRAVFCGAGLIGMQWKYMDQVGRSVFTESIPQLRQWNPHFGPFFLVRNTGPWGWWFWHIPGPVGFWAMPLWLPGAILAGLGTYLHLVARQMPAPPTPPSPSP